MKPAETASSYDQLASHWGGTEFNRENGLAAHKRALQFSKAKTHALDVGCGSSGRFIDLLLEEGFVPEGLDISEKMIELAKDRHPCVTFHLADISEWTLHRRYDFISAWDSIWHLPLSDHEKVIRKLIGGLSESGIMIFTCGGLDIGDEVTNPSMGQPLYHATLGLPKIQSLILDSGCIIRHLEFDQYPQPHVYIIIQKS